MIRLRRISSSSISAKPLLAYQIVSDYAAYSDWLPGLKSSKLLARESNFALVELEFRANPGKILTVECIHAPTSMVVLRSLSGHLPRLKIEWTITPGEFGDARVTLKMEAPRSLPFLAGYKGFFHPANVLKGLSGVVAASGEGPAGEKIVEINETEEGLECWFKGTRYRMVAGS